MWYNRPKAANWVVLQQFANWYWYPVLFVIMPTVWWLCLSSSHFAGPTTLRHKHTQSCCKVLCFEFLMMSCFKGIFKYCVRDVCFCPSTGQRRDYFKRKRPGMLVNLKKYVDLEKDHMGMFLRYFTPFYVVPFYNKLLYRRTFELFNTIMLSVIL